MELGEDDELLISSTVGYMLKVLKNGKTIPAEIKQEFASIRHGDYMNFIKVVGGRIPSMVIGGDIEPIALGNGNRNAELRFLEGEIDFAQLIASGPSIQIFNAKCHAIYGPFNDEHISDEIFRKLVAFEIRIRMHATNRKLVGAEDTLVTIIDNLSSVIGMNQNEIEQIHAGRKFLNQVKHNKKTSYDWSGNCDKFLNAYNILEKYGIKIF